jgi:hypothetical protein
MFCTTSRCISWVKLKIFEEEEEEEKKIKKRKKIFFV